jgi:hypothetical protein
MMRSQWYYSRDSAVDGPFSDDQMKDLIKQRLLRESDFVWRQGRSAHEAVAANEVFEFGATMAEGQLPDWLADVGTDGSGPMPALISEPQSNHENPEWLEDLRLWVGLESFVRTDQDENVPTEVTLSAPTNAEGIPDWLQGWKAREETKPAPTPVPEPVAPPLAMPVAPLAMPVASTSGKPADQIPLAMPIAAPIAQAPPSAPVAPPEKSAAEKMREESGYDADTGRILDPVKFRRWQQQARVTSSVSNASFLEVFRKARLAIEAWVDDDRNRAHVLHADENEIRSDQEIQAILQDAGRFGKDLQDKLLHHLRFMLHNRRKYYLALAR